MIHAAPPIALSVPPPPLPPPPALPQTPPVIQHQGAYASGPPIPTYSATPQQTTTGVHSAAAYAQPYSNVGPHRYTGYTRTRYISYYRVKYVHGSYIGISLLHFLNVLCLL